MVNTTGLDNEGNVARTGKGYFWCAGATSQWWKDAGLQLPTYSSTGGPALCNRWLEWGKENGYFSSIPKEGAAILYRGGRKPGAVHIGIVESIIPGIGVGTIDFPLFYQSIFFSIFSKIRFGFLAISEMTNKGKSKFLDKTVISYSIIFFIKI